MPILVIIAIVALVAMIAAVALMPKPKNEQARASGLGDFNFPRSGEGDPLGALWGTHRFKGPNTIGLFGFRAIPIHEKQKSGFSSKKVTIGYMYRVTLDLALVLGQGVRIMQIYADDKLAWDRSVDGIISEDTNKTRIHVDKMKLLGGKKSQGGLEGYCTFYHGNFGQSRDAHLAAGLDPDVPAYPGICHIVMEDFYIGNSSQPPALNFVIQRLTNSLTGTWNVMPNGLDINPAEMVYDCIVQKWGLLGISSTQVDTASFLACAQKLYEEERGMSLKVESANEAKDVITEALRIADAVLYEYLNKIYMVLIRNDYVIEDLPHLDENDIVRIRDFSKSTWDDTYNQCRVTFKSRDKLYNDSIALAQDFANIEFQQKVRSSEVSFPACTTEDVANMLAAQCLSVVNVPLYQLTLECNRKQAINFRPGDVFVLSYSYYGLEQIVLRVQKIDFGTLDNEIVIIYCLQDKFSANDVIFAPPGPSEWTPISSNPAEIISRFPMETIPFFYRVQGLDIPNELATVTGLAVPPANLSSAFDLYVEDNIALTAVEYTGTARLAVAYASTEGGATYHDSVTGIVIKSLSFSEMDLQSFGTRNDSLQGQGLLVINGEILSYTDYTSLGAGQYRLTGISRKMFDTMPASHAVDDYVYFLDDVSTVAATTEVAWDASVPVRVVDNTPEQAYDADAQPADTLAMQKRAQRPAAPVYATIGGSRTPTPCRGAMLHVAWRQRNRLAQEILWYDSATQAPEAGTTYRLDWRVNAGAWTSVTGITSPFYNLDTTGHTGILEVRIWAVRDGLESRIYDNVFIELTDEFV